MLPRETAPKAERAFTYGRLPNRTWWGGFSFLLGLLLGLNAGAAQLSGSFVPAASVTNIQLTAVGKVDWLHWGLGGTTNLNRKGAVTPRLNVALVGTNSLLPIGTNNQRFSWSDGTPTAAAINSPQGVALQGLTNGFEITAPADVERQRLWLFAGAYAASGLLEATLSDGSAAGFYDESLTSLWTPTNAAALTNGAFVIDFAAASPGATLTIRFTTQTLYHPESGLVLVQAAALASNTPPTVVLTSPTNSQKFFQSNSVMLTASAQDPDGSIAGVEFYAGTTNQVKLGEALTPPYELVWEMVPPGSYTITARALDNEGALGTSAPITFIVQNNFAPTVTWVSPADLSAFTLPTNILLSANAVDIDGTITNVAFYNGSTKLSETNTSSFQYLWINPPAGEHFLSVRATDNQGATTVSSAIDIFATQTGGHLTAMSATVQEPVDLDAAGPADWAHWGLLTQTSFNHKRGVASQVSNFSVIGNDQVFPYGDNANSYSWTDGTPILAATNTTSGVYVTGRRNGFALTVPAGVTTNILKIFVGSFAARGRLLAYLNDFSAPVISDVSVDNAGNGPSTVYALQYAAASPGKLLRVRFIGETMYNSVGNVTLQAAALDTGNLPPTAAVTNPVTGASFVWPSLISIGAAAADADGSVTNVEFFQNGIKLGQKTIPPYTWIWSNAPAGTHLLSVRATDNCGVWFTSRPAEIFLGPGGGSLVVTSAFPAAQVDLTAQGTVDWTHWGLSTANSFNHKSGAAIRISNADPLQPGQVKRYQDNFSGYSWTNGTPTPVAMGTKTGIYMQGTGNGFELSVPADTARRQLRVYVGLYGARARFEAALSDNSAKPFVDTSLLNVFGNHYRVYTLDYKAASAGQQLVIRHSAQELFDEDFGNVTLQAASLSELPPPQLLDPHWDGQTFRFGFNTLPYLSYTIEYADSVASTNWQSLGTFPGTGSWFPYTNVPPPWPQIFFRVIEH